MIMGRKKSGILTSIRRKANAAATNAIRQGIYETMWGEAPPKGKRKVKKDGDMSDVFRRG